MCAPPVPIPNTEVKAYSPNDTCCFDDWESRVCRLFYYLSAKITACSWMIILAATNNKPLTNFAVKDKIEYP